MKDREQFYLDIAILIGIAVIIYYLKFQSTGETFSPASGIMAIMGFD